MLRYNADPEPKLSDGYVFEVEPYVNISILRGDKD